MKKIRTFADALPQLCRKTCFQLQNEGSWHYCWLPFYCNLELSKVVKSSFCGKGAAKYFSMIL